MWDDGFRHTGVTRPNFDDLSALVRKLLCAPCPPLTLF